MSSSLDLPALETQVAAAVEAGKLTASAAKNITTWLTASRYAEYASQVAEHISGEKWQELDNAFWTIIPFGTGGRRGRMYPIGSNAINDRTIGESAAGLARYVREHVGDTGELSCAIAFDTRHNSTRFARLCSEIMVAEGFTVYLLTPHRSTPELSFLVRHRKCSCGIMVTASHNPPSDNAVKCYWSTGGQILPPHDAGVIDRVMNVDEIDRVDFDEALRDGKIVECTAETDAAFVSAVVGQSSAGPRDLKILYSPLHGVGATAVVPVLSQAGFAHVEVFQPHAEPSGDFPNVPGHVSNPENPAVFEAMITQAQREGHDVIMATDPDCDRLGCAAPCTVDKSGPWATLNGNQIGALLADYALSQRKDSLTSEHYLVKTLVTTELIRRIGDAYGVKTYGDLLVGFKWIGGTMDDKGPEKFVFGAEESHGYLVGTYARDKDGSVAALLLAELAAAAKAEGLTLHDKMHALYQQHGYHAEQLLNQVMPGSEGMAKMQTLMQKFRQDPPSSVGGLAVAQVRDYAHGTRFAPGQSPQKLDGPTGDMVIIDLAEEGNYVAVRPSGTEPKVKFYMFAYVSPSQCGDLAATTQSTAERLTNMQNDLAAFAESV
ncbi:MAG: phospho-sugar mutase [Planctomycetales bacterium]|nr:phospho-sugar mutase [Planctomycetales bacterium]